MDSKTETVSDNELIAEFMGAERRQGPFAFNQDQILVQWIIKGNPYNQHRDDIMHWYQPVELKYHESWDWLMPVVEKIENGLEWKYAVLIEHELYSEDSEWNVTIHDAGNATYIEMPPSKYKIKAVYKAVVEFIRWFNSQSPDTIK